MKQYLLGIDVGTTGTKALLFDESGAILCHAYRSYALSTPGIGRSEQNMDELWLALRDTVRELCAKPGIGENVAAISLSTQGGTVVPVDAAGMPLRPAIVWNDARATAQKAAFLREFPVSSAMYEKTGWNLSPGLPAMEIRWIRENEPDIFARTAKFLTVPDYISQKLTGIAAVDASNAGINQLCNIRTGEYDPELLAFAGITVSRLPVLVPSGKAVGQLTAEAARELGLTERCVFVSGAHDQYAVALGAGANRAGEILIGSGTCWVITAIGDAPDFSSGLAQSIAAVPGLWGSLWSLSTGGVCLDWLRQKITVGESGAPISYEVLNTEIASRRAGEDGLFFFPFSGRMAGSDVGKGIFVGLDLSHDRFHLARAVMEGIVFQIVWKMEEFAIKPGPDGIRLAGGASKSAVWVQMLADISGLPVRIPAVADLACVGAAILAGVGSGIYENAEDGYARLSVTERVVCPDAARHERYQRALEAYQKTRVG